MLPLQVRVGGLLHRDVEMVFLSLTYLEPILSNSSKIDEAVCTKVPQVFPRTDTL